MRGISILVLGESGTGKELFAQAIHQASPRRGKPLLAINCAALSKTLLESELFGHTRGAFTGADKERKGAFELADGGTIFLDEIAECDVETQAKLLRVLQPVSGQGPSVRAIRRLGDDRDRLVDVRVVAATNRDLHKAIRNGTFREDLYYRLATVTITLPPLRDRKADVPKIAERLLDQINRQFASEELNYKHKSLSAPATAFVKRHDWPGNVRQLYNVLVQAAVLTEAPTLDRSDLVAALGEMPAENRAPASPLDRPLGGDFDLGEFLNKIHASYLRRGLSISEILAPKTSGPNLKPAASRRLPKNGRMPVGLISPMILPSGALLVCSNLKISLMTMVSPSIPETSEIEVILRLPSLRRDCWMMRSIAEATCSRITRTGKSMPDINSIVSRRERASRGELACSVVSEPW